MPWSARARWLMVPLLAVLAGCADSPMILKGQVQQLQQQQIALSKQNQELNNRAVALDRINEEKEVQLAQARQQAQVAEDQLTAVREQLRGTTSQLAELRQEQQASDKKVQTLTASLRRRGGVSILPNNSLQEALPAIHLPGVEVRRDGDVIRIELPAARLYPAGDGRISPEGVRLVTSVAAVLARDYPDQRIGVEGHTSKGPLPSGIWQSHHHLSVTEAMGVYNVLVTRTRLKPSQLVVAGHGANYPVVSNATPAGRQRNHRVELVIYPDKANT
jgi:flagellar motor protein MotB